MPRLNALLVLLSLATVCAPATLASQTTYGAVPGSISFTQGQVNIDGQPINNRGGAGGEPLQAGQTLATANGNADILLAPGALLRIGDNSTVRMVAAGSDRTEVRLEQGIANVSVNVVRRDHLLLVDLRNGQTQLLSRGLYAFNTATDTMRVFNGEADVFPGTDLLSNEKAVKVREGHELELAEADGRRLKPASFDRELADTDLLPWVGPRESEAALAGDRTAQGGSGTTYAAFGSGAYGFYGDGPYAYDGYPYGFGYPYGPYGFYGYPFFGVGFGFYGGGGFPGGFPGRFPGGAPFRGPFRGPVPIRGGSFGAAGGFAGRDFSGGGHSFGGGGFHGGGRR